LLWRFLRQWRTVDKPGWNRICHIKGIPEGEECCAGFAGCLRLDLYDHRLLIPPAANMEGELSISGHYHILLRTRSQPMGEHGRVCFSLDTLEQKLGRIEERSLLSQGKKISRRGSNFLLHNLKDAPVVQNNLRQVRLANIAHRWLFMKHPEEFFNRDESMSIGHKAELIRPISQNILHQSREGIHLAYMFSSHTTVLYQ